ncbi:hypothetical protein GCM10010967_37860 [Dyadobacter beijingensis]|uniref:DUF4136 domain-containing protein n=1 Tax=Dyadobacter beijingensis TaxID=365489 RepID=A0ABQ2I724_9BACT|nr:hypothetical protein [Dyadobacter beijingensis]GGN00139.1 hypothetical protein GCM10010967_37860 [Dyadobacter beijingensis]
MAKLGLFLTYWLFLKGCVGPLHDHNFALNNADGRYIMTALIDITQGRAIPVERAAEKRLVRITWIPTDSINNYDSVFLDQSYFYRFKFYDVNENETLSFQAAPGGVGYDEKHYQESQWLTISDSTGILVVLERDSGRGVTTRLMISNIMKSTSYREDLDTIRYIYRMKFN